MGWNSSHMEINSKWARDIQEKVPERPWETIKLKSLGSDPSVSPVSPGFVF